MRRRVLGLAVGLLVVVCLRPWLADGQENVPEVARPLLEEAERERAAGRLTEAIDRYRGVLKLAPDLASAYVSLGALYTQQGRLDEALEVFRTGLQRAPAHNLLLYNAAAIELQQGRAPEALAYIDRAIANQPADASLHFLRGTALRRLDRLNEALEAFRTVVRLDSRDAHGHFNLGNVYHQLERPREALDAYREAIRHDRTLLPAFYNLGAVLFELGNDGEALSAYEVALAPVEKQFAAGRPVEATYTQAYLNLGAIYLRRQEWARAADAYGKAVRLSPGEPAAHYNLGYIHYEAGRFDEAYAAYEQALALDRALPFAYLHLGLIDFRRSRLEAATRWLTQGLPQFEPDARRTALLTLAEIALRAGDDTGAEQRYRQVLELDARDLSALVGLGSLARRDGRLDEARTLLAQARDVAPSNPAVLLELAALARTEGDISTERRVYLDILQREGDRADLWPVRVNLVSLLVREGAVREAIQTMEPLIQRLSTAAGDARETTERPPAGVRQSLRTIYAILLAQDRQQPAALRELRTALRDDPAYDPARVAVGVLEALSGHLDTAEAELRGVVSGANPGVPLALAAANLGHALWLMDRLDEATTHLRTAAELFPDHVSLQAALGESALAARNYPEAITRLTHATNRCAGGSDAGGQPDPAPGPQASQRQTLQVIVGGQPGGTERVCLRARRALGAALLGAASQRLDAAATAERAAREARGFIEQALALPLESSSRAHALFLRGTLSLLADQADLARVDLRRAVSGDLAVELRGSAHNNLGVALYRIGAVADAQREFEMARTTKPPLADATLNLAITLHERGEGQRALALYEDYIRLQGSRQEEVRAWVDNLRRIYR